MPVFFTFRRFFGRVAFDEAGGQHRVGRLAANAVVDLCCRIERDIKVSLHESGSRLFVLGDTILGISTVLRIADFRRHHLSHGRIGHRVVLADPKVWAPGTSMGFSGLASDTDRVNLIAFLDALDD